MKLWHDMHQLLHEEQPYTFLFASPERAFVHERFNHVVQHDYRLYFSEWYVTGQAQLY